MVYCYLRPPEDQNSTREVGAQAYATFFPSFGSIIMFIYQAKMGIAKT